MADTVTTTRTPLVQLIVSYAPAAVTMTAPPPPQPDGDVS